MNQFGRDAADLAGGAGGLDVTEIGKETHEPGQPLRHDRVVGALGFQLLWVGLLLALCEAVLRAATRKVVVQGG